MIAPLANDQSIDRSGLGQRHTSTILHATVRLPKARRGETAATKSARNILFQMSPIPKFYRDPPLALGLLAPVIFELTPD
jgi:hypothetical protein